MSLLVRVRDLGILAGAAFYPRLIFVAIPECDDVSRVGEVDEGEAKVVLTVGSHGKVRGVVPPFATRVEDPLELLEFHGFRNVAEHDGRARIEACADSIDIDLVATVVDSTRSPEHVAIRPPERIDPDRPRRTCAVGIDAVDVRPGSDCDDLEQEKKGKASASIGQLKRDSPSNILVSCRTSPWTVPRERGALRSPSRRISPLLDYRAGC